VARRVVPARVPARVPERDSVPGISALFQPLYHPDPDGDDPMEHLLAPVESLAEVFVGRTIDGPDSCDIEDRRTLGRRPFGDPVEAGLFLGAELPSPLGDVQADSPGHGPRPGTRAGTRAGTTRTTVTFSRTYTHTIQ
jgi:hypothetical protein